MARARAGSTVATDATTSSTAIASRTHPRYQEWLETWRQLGYVYEGDGPYLDGTALVPHSRELLYRTLSDGSIDFTTVVGEKRKFTQRKILARYENFASTIIDTLVDHQYAKLPTREIGSDEDKQGDTHPYMQWLEDVDGEGTHIDDWLKWYQPLVNTYGHLYVLMDRLTTGPQTAAAANGVPTRADQGRPVLRCYAPPDAPDWLAKRNKLTAIKFVEPVERTSLVQQALPATVEYVTWDDKEWVRYNDQGNRINGAAHQLGLLPVMPWYARRRARIPIIGRSILRDPKVFRDHYNIISELRELFRAQTFSMLTIGLGDKETIAQARDRIGDHLGTDAIIYTRSGAGFIAPEGGPAKDLTTELQRLERNFYRLAGLPWQSDSLDAESADSLRIKAADLNRTLGGLADEAERLEYAIARRWYRATYGADAGEAKFQRAKIRIQHPDEFQVQQLTQALLDAQSTVTLGVGPTATTAVKMGVVQIALKGLDEKQLNVIKGEIEKSSKEEDQHKGTLRTLAQQAAAQKGQAGPGGNPAEGVIA